MAVILTLKTLQAMNENKERIEPREVTVKIQKYKALLDILEDNKKTAKLIVVVFFIAIALFAGIALVAITLKSLYPYNDIVTNVMGATTIKNENKQISYWLFNTAELWANSGIKVKIGQTISVRASGKKHTAIHHLVDDAMDNPPVLREPWVGSEGFDNEYEGRPQQDKDRAQFKIVPGENQDALLMVVADKRPIGRPKNTHIHVIGNQSESIHIERNGTLFFAINDIVLDTETISEMMREITGVKPEPPLDGKKMLYPEFLQRFGTDSLTFLSIIGKNRFGLGAMKDNPGTIELFGYYNEGNVAAWFDDNVGSFLIVVESVED